MPQGSRRRAETLSWTGGAVSLAGTGLLFYLAGACNSAAADSLAWFYAAATLAWLFGGAHLRARRLAAEERQALEEAERLREDQGRARLFEGAGLADAPQQARLREMERYGAPLASLSILLLLAFSGTLRLRNLLAAGLLAAPEGEALRQTYPAAAASFLLAFLSFGLGKYAAWMAREPRLSLLRAGGGFLITSAFLSIALSISFLAGSMGYLAVERLLAGFATLSLLAVALEMGINFILDFYRPRLPGETPRPVYDNRLTGLLAEPHGLFQTFAHTMDYQFGFKVSETWFFRFLHRAIAPILLFQLLSLYLLTCIVVVQPGERAVIERWGRPRGVAALPPLADDTSWDRIEAPLGPGLHLKLPWPIEIERRLPAERIQQIWAGAPQMNEEEERKRYETLSVVSWDAEHVKDEFNYVMPLVSVRNENQPNGSKDEERLDAMYISGGIMIHYRIGRGPEHPGDLYRHLYRFTDPRQAMVTLCEREITSHFCGANFWDVLVDDVRKTEQNLRLRLQKAVDGAGLGVEVIFVSLWNIHPPAGEVGKSYQEVVSAQQEAQTKILQARAIAIGKPNEAAGTAFRLQAEAESYALGRAAVSSARAERFRQQLGAFRAAPGVYRHREYMRSVEEGLAGARSLTILSPGVTAVIDDKQNSTASAVDAALRGELTKKQ